MGQRRMFSQRITNSAKFQQMSPSAQALYFHLGMAADDDGVVEAFMVMRTVKAMEDDFRVLVLKEFVKPLNEELVTYILDWNEHNLIRPDRLTPSMYRELLVKVIPDLDLVQPRKRADVKGLPAGRPVDVQWTPQDKLSKDKLILCESSDDSRSSSSFIPRGAELTPVTESGEPVKKPKRTADTVPEAQIRAVCDLFGKDTYALIGRHKAQREAIKSLLELKGIDAIRGAIQFSKDYKDEDSFLEVFSPHELSAKWARLLAAKAKRGV